MKKHKLNIVIFMGLMGSMLTAQAQETPLPEAQDSKTVYTLKDGFSGEQGKNGWSYEYILKDGSYKKIETFDAEKKVWKGPKGYWEVGAIEMMLLHLGYQNDVALTWTSPADGKLWVGGVPFKSRGDTTDGVQVCIKHNDVVVWPKEGGFHMLKAKDDAVKAEALNLEVKAGDTLRFIANRVKSHKGDRVFVNPYLVLTPATK